MTTKTKVRRRRNSGTDGRRAQRKRTIPPMLPTLDNLLPRTEPLSDEQIRIIDHESMRVLEEVLSLIHI